jgi:hypothetical protein
MINSFYAIRIGLGMDGTPGGQFAANAVYFLIGILAYNADRLFTLKTLDE